MKRISLAVLFLLAPSLARADIFGGQSVTSTSGFVQTSATNTWTGQQTFQKQITVSSNVVDGSSSQGTLGQSLQSNAGSAPTWVNVPAAILSTTSTYTSSQTFNNGVVSSTDSSNYFSNRNGQSIYGNFIGSSTVSGGSSVTVTLNGTYTHWVIRLTLTNATGGAASVYLRANNDAANSYSYSSSGFVINAATGASCGNQAANSIALTSIGAANNNNHVSSGLYFVASLALDVQGITHINGTTSYLEKSGNNVVNLNVAGDYNSAAPTSIQAWFGAATSCTSETDPLTGTTGTMEIWGVF